MGVCCVPLCTAKRGAGAFSLLRFPADEKKRRKWLELIRRKDYVLSDSSRICSWHFPTGKKDGPKRFPWNLATYNRLEPSKKRDRGMTTEEEVEDLKTRYAHAMKELTKIKAENKKLSLRVTECESVLGQISSLLLKCNYDAI